ncbi:quinon protein alcohol dehydrogenase-like superfamily [Mycena polygramma]|nr:quinon protein alcohol dehydrogenase-like superfamily [Mycena polygramma]
MKTGQTERRLQGHFNVVCVVFSPDGGRLLSDSGGSADDNPIRLWNTESGETVWKADFFPTSAVAFSSDGRYLAAASQSSNNTITLWNAKNGEHERDFIGHSQWVYSLALSPDARMLASGSADQTILIWNTETGETDYILLGHSGRVHSLAFSPDNGPIVSAAFDGTIRVWNLNSEHIGSKSAWIWSVGFSPYSEAVFSRTGDGIVQIWNAQTGNKEQELPEATAAASSAVLIPTYNPFEDPNPAEVDCQLAQTRDYISLYSSSDPEHKRLWIWSDYRHGISASAFDGSRACVGYNSGRVVIVDMAQQ